MLQLIRTNPGLIVWPVIAVVASLVLGLIAVMMTRAGASLRPIYWLAGFMLLVGAPQFIGHLYFAISALRREAPRVAAMQQLASATTTEARRAAVHTLFGPDADPALVIDARPLFGDATARAETAAFASLPNGESILLARFHGYSAAEKAWVAYLQTTGLAHAGGRGDSQRGYAVTRPAGDRAFALHMTNMLGVWTGPDDAAIRQRITTTGFALPHRAPLAPALTPTATTAASGSPVSLRNVVTIGGALATYLFLVVLYFFKGAAWAGASPAQPGVETLDARDLGARLEAVNHLDAPFRIERGEREGEFFAIWRYGDARWIDHARAHGLHRMHRIRLTLDAASHVVRATDFSAAYDWSAGPDAARIAWRGSLGITFFQREHQRVFGLQLDEEGRLQADPSYAYTFDLQEMKAPLIAAVTRAGWTWRPVVVQGPRWLRWLTE